MIGMYDAAEEAASDPHGEKWKACAAIFNSDIWEKQGMPVFPGMVSFRYIDPCLRAIRLMTPEQRSILGISEKYQLSNDDKRLEASIIRP
jgi:hypothetical protein